MNSLHYQHWANYLCLISQTDTNDGTNKNQNQQTVTGMDPIIESSTSYIVAVEELDNTVNESAENNEQINHLRKAAKGCLSCLRAFWTVISYTLGIIITRFHGGRHCKNKRNFPPLNMCWHWCHYTLTTRHPQISFKNVILQYRIQDGQGGGKKHQI